MNFLLGTIDAIEHVRPENIAWRHGDIIEIAIFELDHADHAISLQLLPGEFQTTPANFRCVALPPIGSRQNPTDLQPEIAWNFRPGSRKASTADQRAISFPLNGQEVETSVG